VRYNEKSFMLLRYRSSPVDLSVTQSCSITMVTFRCPTPSRGVAVAMLNWLIELGGLPAKPLKWRSHGYRLVSSIALPVHRNNRRSALPSCLVDFGVLPIVRSFVSSPFAKWSGTPSVAAFSCGNRLFVPSLIL